MTRAAVSDEAPGVAPVDVVRPDAAPDGPPVVASSPTAQAASPREQLLDQLRSPASPPESHETGPGSANTEEKLWRLLVGVRQAIPDLTGCLIASDDGLPICHDYSESDGETVGAMAAVALMLATRITDSTRMGPLLETVVRAADGYFVVYPVGSSAVLVLAGPPTVNLGVLRIEARALSAHVNDILR